MNRKPNSDGHESVVINNVEKNVNKLEKNSVLARTTPSRHKLGQETINQQRQKETRTVGTLGAGVQWEQ